MGTRFAPQYANLFMHRLEEDFFATRSLRPDLYVRYIDDIFIVWSHGEESLTQLHQAMNDFHPTIKLVMNHSSVSVPFLDTQISVKNGQLCTSLYRKPTDKMKLLHFTSSHPRQVKQAIPYSQALRVHRICTDAEDRDQHLQQLETALLHSGYRGDAIREQFDRPTNTPRTDLLTRRQSSSADDRVPFVVEYFPGAERLRRGLQRLQHLIDEDSYLSEVFPHPPLLSFRQPSNLKQRLVRSKLPTVTPDEPGSVRPCNAPRCLTCNIICTDVTVSRDSTTLHVKGRHTCGSRNLVYLIRCSKGCPDAWYIGETGQTLRQRMNGHRATVRNRSPLPVPEHFGKPDHSAAHMRVSVLRGGLRDTRQRRIAEQQLIGRLRTHETGLNSDLGFMAHYR